MGQTMDAMSNPVTFEKDPQGFGGNDWAGRFIGNGLKGLDKGLQNYNQQNAMMRQGGPQAPIPQSQAMPVDPSYFQPQAQQGQPRSKSPFFYGYGER